MKGIKKGSAQAASYAEQMQRRKEMQTVKVIAIAEQMILDAVALTLNEEFGLGEERLKRFQVAFDRKYGEIRKLEKDDTEDGEYSRHQMEKAERIGEATYQGTASFRHSLQLA